MHLESHLAMRVHSRCARVAARTRAHMLASERYARKVITLAFQDMRGLEHRKTTCIYVQHRWCANDAQPMTKRMASRPYAI